MRQMVTVLTFVFYAEGTLLIFTVDANVTLVQPGGHDKSFDLELSFAVCLATEH